jgi:hypothetical protein
MRDKKQVWTMAWTQSYDNWPKPKPKQQPELESEVMDLTLAREVLARIMAK